MKKSILIALMLAAVDAGAQTTPTHVTGTFKTPGNQTPAQAGLKQIATVATTAVYGSVDFEPWDAAGNRATALLCGSVTYPPQRVHAWIKSDGTLIDGAAAAGVDLIPNAGCQPTGAVYRATIYFAPSSDGRVPAITIFQQKSIPAQTSVDWGALAISGIQAIAYTGYSTIQDETANLAARNTVNFTGAGVSCADNPSGLRTDCTITGVAGAAYATVQEEGTSLTQRATLNFIGSGVTCADNAGSTRTDCTVSAGGAGSQHQVNAVNLLDNTTVNFQDTTALTWSNPSLGNVRVTLGIVPVASGGLNNSATPSSDGQIPIWNAAQAKYVPGDPIVSGPAAEGAAPLNNPVWVAGKGADGFIHSVRMANDGTVRVDPAGTTTQPVSASSLPLPTGAATESTLSALNAKHGTDVTADYDTGAGTQNMILRGIALPASGGAVAGGTASNPLRTDPTGTTTQPISAASLPLPSGAAQEHTTAASPHSARLSDGAAFYDAAKTGQLPSALVGGRLDVNVGNAPTVTANAGTGTFSTSVSSVTATTASGTITALDGTVSISVGGFGAVGVQLSGTWTATALFEATVDGTNWQAIEAWPTNSATSATSSTANGLWYAPAGGLSQIRVRGNPFTSGTVTVTLRATTAAAKMLAAGGTGGTSSSFGSAFPGTGTAAGLKATASAPSYVEGNMAAFSSDLSGLLRVRCDSGCAAAGDNVGSSAALNALNAAASVSLAGENGVEAFFATGTLVGTVVAEVSPDGGTTWQTAAFLDPVSGATTTSVSNPSNQTLQIAYVGAESQARVRVSSFTSGTVTATLRSTVTRPWNIAYGSDGTNIRALSTTTAGVLKVDGSGATQPVSGTVTANAGTGTFNIQANASVNLAQMNAVALGSPSAYGTSPGAVNVQGVNAFITNTPAVTLASTTITGTVDVGDRAARLVGQVEGRAASGAAKAGNPNQIGGVFNTTQPTVTTGQAVEAQFSARGAMLIATGVDVPHVVCDSGCGGASSFADNAAFTFGTTPVNNMGAVVDDTATNSVTENSAGAPRMSSSRILYGNLRNASGTEVVTATAAPGASDLGLVVRNIPSGTQAVSGTVTANVGTTNGLALDATVSGTQPRNITQLNSVALASPFDVDSGAGTQNVQGVSLRKAASGGSVEYGTSTDPLRTDPTGTTTQPVSGTVTANQGTANATPWNENLAQVNGVTPLMGNGVTGTGSPRITIASDNTAFAVKRSDGTNTASVDPCQDAALTRTSFNISQTAGAQLIAGTASKQTYVCNLFYVTTTAQNIALVEGTGTVCATGTAGMLGGATAATGQNWAANQGFVQPATGYWFAKTATAADNVCLLQSGTGQISGGGSYVQK